MMNIKRKMVATTLAAAMIASSLMSGCAMLGLSSPETFNQKVIVAYSTVTGINNTATNLLNLRVITADDGENVLKATDAAKAGIDVARVIQRTDSTAADAKLNSIRVALTALQTYLISRSK